MKEAMYYERLNRGEVSCRLCPHYCKIAQGEVGKCRVRKNIDGKLYSLNYGKITSYGYDNIEKKPLFHFHPGKRIFSIGSFGCNLSCKFCQNWQIAQDKPLSVEISDEDILSLAKAKGSIGIAYTYNEPSIWFEYVLHLSKLNKEEGLNNVLVTNGFINPKPLEELLPYIDAMNIDLKSISDDFYMDICNGRVDPVLETIKRSARFTHVEVTTLLIEGRNTNLEEIESIAKTIASIDRDIPLHLSRYFPAYKMKEPETNIDTVFLAKSIADRYLDNVYVGNIF
ncbi:AmmeMemoRadiSam system radical SAM enzyme [Tissierellaceae bacterium HCP3S3_D8]